MKSILLIFLSLCLFVCISAKQSSHKHAGNLLKSGHELKASKRKVDITAAPESPLPAPEETPDVKTADKRYGGTTWTMLHLGVLIAGVSVIAALLETYEHLKAFVRLDETVRIARENNNVFQEDSPLLKTRVIWKLCFSLVVDVRCGIAGVLFIVGIYKLRSDYMVLYLIILAIFIALSVIGVCCYILKRSSETFWGHTKILRNK